MAEECGLNAVWLWIMVCVLFGCGFVWLRNVV